MNEEMTESEFTPVAGRCACGAVHYRLNQHPMFVHCCHCTWCQRESGSAFALNALLETDQVELIKGLPEQVTIPSNSGAGQTIVRCPDCKIALWSHYGGARETVAFVRVGTLEKPDLCPPDIHIFTASKLAWVRLDSGVPQVEQYYRRSEFWPEPSVQRYKKAVAG